MITINRIPEVPFENWLTSMDLEARVEERHNIQKTRLHRFFASIPNLEITENGMLTSVYGNGNTPEEALIDLAQELSEKPLVQNAYKSSRKEFEAPRFV